jgi:hypothetical protein
MIHAAALAPFLALAAAPALAEFGAIAYSAQTGGYGIGWKAGAREQAESDAMAGCVGYGRGCAVTLAFENACGALAKGGAQAAAAAAPRLRDAENRARAACQKLNAAGCEIEVSFCSNR